MKFHKGIYFKVKKSGYIFRIEDPFNAFSKSAWICFRLPTGNCIEGRFIFFEENLELYIQNNEIKIIGE